MSITIHFTPAEESSIDAAAQKEGAEPAELLKMLIARSLAPVPPEVDWQARLKEWQEEDGVRLLPAVSAQELFSQWATEYNDMTEAQRAAEDRLWDDVEKSILATGSAFQPEQGSE